MPAWGGLGAGDLWVTSNSRDPRSNGDGGNAMSFTAQISAVWAIVLLIDFLFGLTFGVVGGAVRGSRRGTLFVPASDDLLSAGARVIYGVFTRDDDGYLRSLLPGSNQMPGDSRGGDCSESHGQEVDR